MKRLIFVAAAVLLVSTNAGAALTPAGAARLAAAARVAQVIGNTIPGDYWRRAHCVVVVPEVRKTAFIVGGEYGNGVMSCRSAAGWGAPVFMQLAKGSWGVQLGAEQIDLVMLVMNEQGVQKLLQSKVNLGIDASIAAGPGGRQAQAAPDALLKADILAYSRAQGLFAGIDMSGSMLRPDDVANRDAYGPKATPRTILAGSRISAPTEATVFLSALNSVMNGAPERPTRTSGEAAQSTPARAATTIAPTIDSDLRTRIVAMQQMLDRLLSDSSSGAVGTSGGNAATVAVDRAKLMQLRGELDALLMALDKR
jgi:lipid-binding SYLF domain-containing protein